MTTVTPVRVEGIDAKTTRGQHLLFLDGIRGLSAFYVVLHHCWQASCDSIPPGMQWLFVWLKHGRFAVMAFIVLSGFCLMLPVSKTSNGALRGGIGGFLLRRARRILPPYLVALAASLAVIAAVPEAFPDSPDRIFSAQPAFNKAVIISHLLAVHNLSKEWIYRINAPFWSVSTEWEIYFLFPSLLLPVWRKLGNVAVVASAFVFGIAVTRATNNYEACFHFGALFAIGMVASDLATRTNGRVFFRGKASAAVGAAIFFASWCVCTTFNPGLPLQYFVQDGLAGASIGCFILWCSRMRSAGTHKPLPLRLVESRCAQSLGVISYSLYLTHMPILRLLSWLTASGEPAWGHHWLLMFCIGVPLSLVIAKLFFFAVERHFVNQVPAAAPSKL